MKLILSVLFAYFFLAATPATAAPEALKPAQIQNVLNAVIQNVEKLYVFPEKRAEIVAAIRADHARGDYEALAPAEFAARLTATLLAASNDKHLNVSFDPVRSAGLDERADPLNNRFFDAEALRLNQGYVHQEIFPGNIRYIRIQMFFWTEKLTARVIDAAAEFLSGGAAVIIDVRGNGGGHSASVQRLISYLMPAKTIPLMRFFDAQSGQSVLTKSTARLPAARVTGRPVYVLIDRGSFSAAEEFAYHIQQFKLGRLVGERTAGGANNNRFVSLPGGFFASLSVGRPIHPISKSNWEGVGVNPDPSTPGPAALDAAMSEALETLSQSPDAKIKAEAQWELPAIQSRLNPIRPSLETMQSLIGMYGEREIRLNGEQLSSQRVGMPMVLLTPLSENLFAVVGTNDVRLRFIRQAPEKVALQLEYRDGRKQIAQRSPVPK